MHGGGIYEKPVRHVETAKNHIAKTEIDHIVHVLLLLYFLSSISQHDGNIIYKIICNIGDLQTILPTGPPVQFFTFSIYSL